MLECFVTENEVYDTVASILVSPPPTLFGGALFGEPQSLVHVMQSLYRLSYIPALASILSGSQASISPGARGAGPVGRWVSFTACAPWPKHHSELERTGGGAELIASGGDCGYT